MFLGTTRTGFTGKGRVILPRKLRVSLNNTTEIILTRGLDGCIWGFKRKEWEKQVKKQLEIPLTEYKGRQLRRYIFSEAEAVAMDKQGRFVIPQPLLVHARLKEDVYLIGAGDHFEIWNPVNWEKTLNESRGDKWL